MHFNFPINPELKRALMSILLGAIVAFLTALIQGLTGLMQSYLPAATAGTATLVAYLRQYV